MSEQRIGKMALINAIVENTGYRQEDVAAIMTSTFDTIVATVKEGKAVSLQGFGSFSSKDCGATTRRNPTNGEPINVPPQTRFKFKPSSKIKVLA